MFYWIGIVVIVVLALIIFLLTRKGKSTGLHSEPVVHEEPKTVASDCCGAHEVCEFDASAFDEEQIVYFDDEELDILRNVREDELTPKQIDDLREVLYTLKTNEISKWMTSLSRRHIHLPTILQQEARQLIVEKSSSN